MSQVAQEIIPINIEEEMRQSYLDYAMSVIVGRALPDVRDGLKPVHRRVLFAMHELGNEWNKAYKKSARVVGDVIGKYHPHGDTAVYDSIVRMAQTFSMRYLLVDGQGNFGSIDGDPAAAMRYTEVRMTKLTHALLEDLEKDTVDFVPNYDESELQPTVMPSRIPNLLVNGTSGIAVGMATNMPPHNLKEVINACIALIQNPNLSITDLWQFIPGPDFPTAGLINGDSGILEAYKTGRGRILVRSKVDIETDEKSGKQSIIVTELPYQVNKARLIEKIAELVKEKKIEGIVGLRDESDKEGIRVVIELRRGEESEVILNNLYTQTQLQVSFGVNMVALVDGKPRLLNLKDLLECFIRHRREVVSRRTAYELKKSRERAHILEGLGVALMNIDPVIALIKAAKTPQEAKEGLLASSWQAGIVKAMLGEGQDNINLCRPQDLSPEYGLKADHYKLSPVQAQAILELRLHRLTGLEQDKILSEFKEIILTIHDLLDILARPERLMKVIQDELLKIKEQFGDERRSQIVMFTEDIAMEDLIAEEHRVFTLSTEGYIKAQPLQDYAAQRRGGKGKIALKMKEEDIIDKVLVASSHATFLCFSNIGKLYWIKGYQIPVASRTSRGKPIVNLLNLQENERINAILPIKDLQQEDLFVFLATEAGVVKKVPLSEFSRRRNSGIIAIDLDEGDKLIGAELTDGKTDVMLFSDSGKAVRFSEEEVRAMGRSAHGVRGIKMQSNQKVISMIALKPEGAILVAVENGYGKRTDASDFPTKGRATQGVIAIQTNDRNGKVIGATQVFMGDELILISNKGTLVRIRVDEVSMVGRNTQGVRLINLAEDELLVGMQRISADVVALETSLEEVGGISSIEDIESVGDLETPHTIDASDASDPEEDRA
ncbi:MAG: DNA gyrase subunit A [Gammaproteobacteria bacterium]